MAARLAAGLAVVFGVSLLVFLLIHLVPGDPVAVMLGEYASGADQQALRVRLGLDRPLHEQWFAFLHDAITFDFGSSLYSDRPVRTLVAQHFLMTTALAGAALSCAVMIGLPLGTLAALRPGGRADTLAAALAVFGMSAPSFVLGPLLMLVFAVWLGWFPIGGADGPRAIVLPALTLGLGLAALLARMTRAALLDELGQAYVLAARARGLAPWRVIAVHAGRNALMPVLTTLGLQLGALLGGAVVTEVVFGWPGLGQLAVEAITRRDYPVVQAAVLVISVGYVSVNVLTDLIALALDPRSRAS